MHGGSTQPAPGKLDFNWGFDGRGDAERIYKEWTAKKQLFHLWEAASKPCRHQRSKFDKVERQKIF